MKLAGSFILFPSMHLKTSSWLCIITLDIFALSAIIHCLQYLYTSRRYAFRQMDADTNPHCFSPFNDKLYLTSFSTNQVSTRTVLKLVSVRRFTYLISMYFSLVLKNTRLLKYKDVKRPQQATTTERKIWQCSRDGNSHIKDKLRNRKSLFNG
jgi:hypothetical protein